MQRPRVCMLTSAHPALDIRIFHKMSRSLSRAGYDVVLVAPHAQDEVVGDIVIRGIPRARRRHTRMIKTTWRAYRIALLERAQVYHFHDPELVAAGILLKLHGKKVIYDAHENVPQQILSKYWIPAKLRRSIAAVADHVELFGARLFDNIITATPSIAGRFPVGKTVAIRNYPVRDEFLATKQVPYTQRPPLVAYIGNLTAIRGTAQMVEAMSMVAPQCQARLALAGTFSPLELELETRRLPGSEMVDFLGWQPRDRVADLLSRARIGLVLFQPAPNHFDACPNKLFEYMAAGIPVIASDFPLLRDMIEEVGCGVPVDPTRPEAIADAISRLLEHPEEAAAMGRRGQIAVEERYNWDVEKKKLLDLYERLWAAGVPSEAEG